MLHFLVLSTIIMFHWGFFNDDHPTLFIFNFTIESQINYQHKRNRFYIIIFFHTANVYLRSLTSLFLVILLSIVLDSISETSDVNLCFKSVIMVKLR